MGGSRLHPWVGDGQFLLQVHVGGGWARSVIEREIVLQIHVGGFCNSVRERLDGGWQFQSLKAMFGWGMAGELSFSEWSSSRLIQNPEYIAPPSGKD